MLTSLQYLIRSLVSKLCINSQAIPSPSQFTYPFHNRNLLREGTVREELSKQEFSRLGIFQVGIVRVGVFLSCLQFVCFLYDLGGKQGYSGGGGKAERQVCFNWSRLKGNLASDMRLAKVF